MFAAMDFTQMRVSSKSQYFSRSGPRETENPGLILRVANSANPWSNFLLIPVKGGWCIRIFTFRHDNILSESTDSIEKSFFQIFN